MLRAISTTGETINIDHTRWPKCYPCAALYAQAVTDDEPIVGDLDVIDVTTVNWQHFRVHCVDVDPRVEEQRNATGVRRVEPSKRKAKTCGPCSRAKRAQGMK